MDDFFVVIHELIVQWKSGVFVEILDSLAEVVVVAIELKVLGGVSNDQPDIPFVKTTYEAKINKLLKCNFFRAFERTHGVFNKQLNQSNLLYFDIYFF